MRKCMIFCAVAAGLMLNGVGAGTGPSESPASGAGTSRLRLPPRFQATPRPIAPKTSNHTPFDAFGRRTPLSLEGTLAPRPPLLLAASAAPSPNYARPFGPPTRPAFIPLPPGAVEPTGWLRDWAEFARDGYTGHMDDVSPDFKNAWAADYKMTGDNLTY
jgi:hypothetical protein